MFPNRDRDSGVRPKRPPAIPPLRPEFDEFLHAPIGEFNDEMPFSVLSALARQDLDPWEEAARLTQLPRESAIARLTSMISSSTVGPGSPAPETAARLVALLPRSNTFGIPSFDKSPREAPRNYGPMIIYLIVGAVILASALLGN